MAKTYLDQLVEYPAKVIAEISSDDMCVGLLLDKPINEITDEDYDAVLNNNISNHQSVDDTVDQSSAYVWVEIDINDVLNRTIKNARLYITVACHKGFMDLNPSTFKGILGNRRDNLVRYIDKLINNTTIMGIGRLNLMSVRTISPISGFLVKEMTYEIPDFNIVDVDI